MVFRFNIDNKYGRVALEATFKAIMGYEQPIVKPPSDYRGDFFKGKVSLNQLFVTFLSRKFDLIIFHPKFGQLFNTGKTNRAQYYRHAGHLAEVSGDSASVITQHTILTISDLENQHSSSV